MVVVLAAVYAYRYHRKLRQEGEDDPSQEQPDDDDETSEAATEADNQQQPEQALNQNLTLSDHWQRTKPLRKSSSDLVRTALACHVPEPKYPDDEDDEALQYSTPYLNRTGRSTRSNSSASGTTKSTTGSRHRRSRRRKHHPPTSSSRTTMMVEQVFREHVRQRWIDAVFGSDFCRTEGYEPPRLGTGEAGIASFAAYTATIPVGDSKLGLTLSKLALGLYVRHVVPHSEAESAGIREGSILVAVNEHMKLLAEPSQQALERMWQYEGLVENVKDAYKELEPISLTLFHPEGHLYTVVLFTTPFGISWAPCGHFAVVQRSHAAAAVAGVRRGSLIASMGGITMRQLTDHVDWGIQLQAQKSGNLEITFCYAPSAARPGQYERQQLEESSTASTKKSHLPGTRTDDGVEVRVHPLENSIRSLWKSPTGGSSPQKNNEESEEQEPKSIAELARQVVAAHIFAPTKRQEAAPTRRFAIDKRYSPSPPFSGVVQLWGALDALVYCLRFHQASYHDLIDSGSESSLTVLQRIGTRTCQPFLLSCIGVLCQGASEEDSQSLADYGDKLVRILLTIAGGDESFSQRLYFVVRSFCATLKDQELLLSAANSLSKQMAANPTLRPVSSRVQQTKSLRREDELGDSDVSPDESPTSVNEGPRVPIRHDDFKKKKKKSVFGVLKRKSKKSGVKTESPIAPSSIPMNIPEPAHTTLGSTRSISDSQTEVHTLSYLLGNATQFVAELDSICDTIERTLPRSISQKVADWALQPWSVSKESALANVTETMRLDLRSRVASRMPSINPVDSTEVLLSVVPDECYILPSAHFPLLLTLNVDKNGPSAAQNPSFSVPERRYRTRVELVGLRGQAVKNLSMGTRRSYFVHASVAGVVKESGRSFDKGGAAIDHAWKDGAEIFFDTRSSWGAPHTLTLRVSAADVDHAGRDRLARADDRGKLHYSSEIGFSWLDLSTLWKRSDFEKCEKTAFCRVPVCFGDLSFSPQQVPERLELELKVTTEQNDCNFSGVDCDRRTRMLLYKHDDDLRQEMFAIEFLRACDSLLKASGLDLKLLTFECVPVGAQRGFVEWISGSVPLSELASNEPSDLDNTGDDGDSSVGHTLSEVARAGFTKYQSLHQLGPSRSSKKRSASDNSIGEFLRSVAFDPDEPMMVRKDVMDTYLKSCAGFCVLTYILGVGDRHLDNLLLHQTGHFFHCDFSFILGRDPKKYLPMRITEAMVRGMGGKESDGFAMFLSLAGAAFCVLRRHENVRVILSLVRTMASANLSGLTGNQKVDEAVMSMMKRLRLDLSDDEAITYVEELIESSISSKLWIAVDAIHSMGKRF